MGSFLFSFWRVRCCVANVMSRNLIVFARNRCVFVFVDFFISLFVPIVSPPEAFQESPLLDAVLLREVDEAGDGEDDHPDQHHQQAKLLGTS